MTDAEFTMYVREFAAEIMQRAADDPIARMGIMHAATQMIAAFAVEEMDPAKTIDDLVGDIHSEATAMVALILSGKVIASESTPIETNIIQMEKLQ